MDTSRKGFVDSYHDYASKRQRDTAFYERTLDEPVADLRPFPINCGQGENESVFGRVSIVPPESRSHADLFVVECLHSQLTVSDILRYQFRLNHDSTPFRAVAAMYSARAFFMSIVLSYRLVSFQSLTMAPFRANAWLAFAA